MKNKNKFYLFAATFLFLSVFFVGVDGVKADDCQDCIDSFGIVECKLNGYCNEEPGFQVTDYGSNSYPADDPVISYPSDESALPGCLAQSDPSAYCAQQGDSYFCNSSGNCEDAGNSQGCNPGCEGGEICQSGACVSAGGTYETPKGSTCDASESCWFYNCCSSASTNNQAPATAEEKAKANASALATSSQAQAAYKTYDAAAQNVKKVCSEDPALASGAVCAKAQADMIAAQKSLDEAITANINAVQSANALSGNASSGAGFSLCANGILATVCSGGGGTPYVAGISTGGLGGYGGGGLGGNYSTGGTANLPKCGANFEDIGGVCFPMNTGLSNAPISAIVQNILSWLMGLFTVLAIMAFVISGVQYLMAAGDADLAETAKDNAKNAMIGIIVGLSGFIIIKAIAAALSGQSIFF